MESKMKRPSQISTPLPKLDDEDEPITPFHQKIICLKSLIIVLLKSDFMPDFHDLEQKETKPEDILM